MKKRQLTIRDIDRELLYQNQPDWFFPFSGLVFTLLVTDVISQKTRKLDVELLAQLDIMGWEGLVFRGRYTENGRAVYENILFSGSRENWKKNFQRGRAWYAEYMEAKNGGAPCGNTGDKNGGRG